MMQNRIVLLLCVVALIAPTAINAQTTVFSDGFEGVTPVALPDASKWDSSFATEFPNTSYLAVEGGLGIGSSNALVVKRVDPNLGQAKALFTPVTSGTVEISLDYANAAPNTGILNFMFNWDGGGSLVMEAATYDSGGSGSRLHWNHAGSGHTPFAAQGGGDLIFNASPTQTYNDVKFTIDLDSVANNVVAELNGVVSDPVSVNFGAGGLENFWVRGWQNTQAALVDDVLITIVPEPSSMCLVVCAACGLLAYQRRRRESLDQR